MCSKLKHSIDAYNNRLDAYNDNNGNAELGRLVEVSKLKVLALLKHGITEEEVEAYALQTIEEIQEKLGNNLPV